MRLGDLDELFRAINKIKCQQGASMGDGLADACQAVLEAPTIDAVPVVHGRWKVCERPTEHLVCTACCRKNFMRVKSAYCPNCGAHMKDGD